MLGQLQYSSWENNLDALNKKIHCMAISAKPVKGLGDLRTKTL